MSISPTSHKGPVELPPLHSLDIDPKMRRDSQGSLNQYHYGNGQDLSNCALHTPPISQHQFFASPGPTYTDHTMSMSFPSPISPRGSLSEDIHSRHGSLSGSSSTGSGCGRIEKPYGHSVHHHAGHHHPHHHPQMSRLDKHEKRRRNHLESEKRRRENIKSGMDGLLALVPKCQDKGLSKAVILNETRDYVMELQNALRRTEKELHEERMKVQQLEQLHYMTQTMPKGHNAGGLALATMPPVNQSLMRMRG